MISGQPFGDEALDRFGGFARDLGHGVRSFGIELAGKTGDGRVLSGVKTSETATTMTLADNQGKQHVLPKSQIEEQQPQSISTMAVGLEKRFTQEEFVDLIAFLASRKERPNP